MKEELSPQQIETILNTFDEVLADNTWDKSNFLRVIAKNIREIRDNFEKQAGGQPKVHADSHLANRVALRSGQQEIYISLYSADGSNMQSWEKIIHNLPKQTTSRPIYANEKDVREAIKHKINPFNEAYVAVFINQSSLLLLHEDKIPIDKLGKALLSLKDKAVELENIIRFVHESGIYHWREERLIKQTSSNSQI